LYRVSIFSFKEKSDSNSIIFSELSLYYFFIFFNIPYI
jgi:hypothetical protein